MLVQRLSSTFASSRLRASLSALSLSLTPLCPLVTYLLSRLFSDSTLPAARSGVRVMSNSPACSLCLCSPNRPGVRVLGAFYLFSFMCKRTAWIVKQLHLCVCVLLLAGQFLLLLTNSKSRLKVQMFWGQSTVKVGGWGAVCL